MTKYWITENEGLLAMHRFLDAYWERGGRTDDGLAILLGSLNISSNGECADPALSKDWLDVVEEVIKHRIQN
jgi:hypothetical protein